MRIHPSFLEMRKQIAEMQAANRASKSASQSNETSDRTIEKCVLPRIMPRTEDKIGNVTVSVAGGDMTQIKADAYVVPEFSDCISEGGVGAAIYRSGAEKGMEAYGKHIANNGKLKFKDIFMAEAGGGNSKYLIHAVTVGASKETAFEVTRDSVFNALNEAQKKGIKSVAIPAIGTGIIGSLTNTESANAILSGVKKFADNGGTMDVCAVVYSTGAGFNDFSKALKSKSYETAEAATGTKQINDTDFVREMSAVIAHPARPASSSSASPSSEEFKAALLDVRTPKGKRLLSKSDVDFIIHNCQKSLFDGKPIPDYEKKIMAVLNNPEEMESIMEWKSKPSGIWRAIQDPLPSTIKANPELFAD